MPGSLCLPAAGLCLSHAAGLWLVGMDPVLPQLVPLALVLPSPPWQVSLLPSVFNKALTWSLKGSRGTKHLQL